MHPVLLWVNRIDDITPLVELITIRTTPTHGDFYGQLLDGELVLNAKLFSLLDFKAPLGSKELLRFAFSLDGSHQSMHDTVAFLPLTDRPHLHSSRLVRNYFPIELTIYGLILQEAEDQSKHPGAFRRIGYAVVSNVDGSVAGTNHCVTNWEPPPWDAEEYRHVKII